MTVHLGEEMFGRDAAQVGFPHLVVCNGVVAITDNEIFGVHVSMTSTSQQVYTAFWQFCTARGVAAADVRSICSSSNWFARYDAAMSDSTRRLLWRTEMQQLATVIGYHGKVYGFDTSIVEPKNGVYVEYLRQPGPPYRCQIMYKRDEKTVKGPTVVVANSATADIAAYDISFNRLRGSAIQPSSVVGKKSLLHSGVFHEVNYATRLVDFDA